MAPTTNNPAGVHAAVNGISLYYEIHGTGKPLIMLHGGFGAFEMFAALSPALAEKYQVIGVDLYGHGRTALTDRPIGFEDMADDIACLVGQLGLGKAALLGFSLGGAVALQTAIRHHEGGSEPGLRLVGERFRFEDPHADYRWRCRWSASLPRGRLFQSLEAA
jgi:pimeloyl-ACP methyl ester carboxylesterase